MKAPNVPIPGANYTSNTKNYPWHRPPDIEGYDETVNYMLSRLETETGVSLIYSLLELEIPVSGITSAMLLQAMSKGKLHIDMAVLAAGPLARSIEIFAKTHDLKYEMGDDATDEIVYTPTQIKALMESDNTELVEDNEPPAAMMPAEMSGTEMESEGLMAAPTEPDLAPASSEEQDAMLGAPVKDTVDEVV